MKIKLFLSYDYEKCLILCLNENDNYLLIKFKIGLLK